MAFQKVLLSVITASFLLLSVENVTSVSIQQRHKQETLRSASFSYNQNGVAADVLRKATNGEADSGFKYSGSRTPASGTIDSLMSQTLTPDSTNVTSNVTSTNNDVTGTTENPSNLSKNFTTTQDEATTNVTTTVASPGVTSNEFVSGSSGTTTVSDVTSFASVTNSSESSSKLNVTGTDDVTLLPTNHESVTVEQEVASTGSTLVIPASDRADVIGSDESEVYGSTGSDAVAIFGDRRRDAARQKPEAPPDKGNHVFKVPEFPHQDSQKIAQSLKGIDNTELFRSLYETQPDAPRYAFPETEVPLNVFGLPPKYRYRHPAGNVEALEPPRVRTNDHLPGPVVDHAVRRGSGWRNDDNKFARLYDLHPDTQGFAHPQKEVPLNIFGLPPKFRYPHPFGHVNGSPPKVVHTNAYLSGPVTDVIEDLPKLSMHISAHPATHNDGISHYDKQDSNLKASQSQMLPQILPPPPQLHQHQRPHPAIPAAERVIQQDNEEKPFEIPRHLPSALRDQMESIFKGIQEAVANVQSNIRADEAKDAETKNQAQTESHTSTGSHFVTESVVAKANPQRPSLADFPNLNLSPQTNFAPDFNSKGPRDISQISPAQEATEITKPKTKDSGSPIEPMQAQQSIQNHRYETSPSLSVNSHPFAKYSQGPIRYVNPQLIEPIKVSNVIPAEATSNFDLATALESMLTSSSSLQAGGYYGNKLHAVNQHQTFNKHHSKQLAPEVAEGRFKYTDPHQTDDIFNAGPVQQWLNQHGINAKPVAPSAEPGGFGKKFGPASTSIDRTQQSEKITGKSLKATLLQTLSNMMAATKNRLGVNAPGGQPAQHIIQLDRGDSIDRAMDDGREKHVQNVAGDGATAARQNGRQFIYRRPPIDRSKIKLHVNPNQPYNGGSGEKPSSEEYIFKTHDEAYRNKNVDGHGTIKYPTQVTGHDEKEQFLYGTDGNPPKTVNYEQNGDGGHFVPNPPSAQPISPPKDYQQVPTQQHAYHQAVHRKPQQHNRNPYTPQKQQHHHQYDRPRHPPHFYHHPKPRPPPPHHPQHNNYGYHRPQGILDMLLPKLISLGLNLGLTKEVIFQKSDRRQGYGEPPPLPKITLRLGLKKNIDARLALKK